MATYELRFKASVAKDLKGLPRADIQRLLAKIDTLRVMKNIACDKATIECSTASTIGK